ncbi:MULTISPECIES: hypothetical protein [Nocardia]|uniref:hypothetical protein n=1 Tax=Nocardia TaxID=1817 RepID=UPI000D69ECE8|nr:MULTISPECIES: hypothetical protein [Nocardia]
MTNTENESDSGRETFTLELEIDGAPGAETALFEQRGWVGEGRFEAISISLDSEEDGHGFGVSEIVTIIVSIPAGVATSLVTDAVRTAVGRVIRSVKGRTRHGEGSREGLNDVIDSERHDNP